MSNTSSTAPALTPSIGDVNELFELPDNRVGDNRRAICIRQNPLLRIGTPGREAFENTNQMTIEVKFKINTDQEVDINAEDERPPRVGASKKVAKPVHLKVIDSKSVNCGYLEIQLCPFGIGLIEFKNLVAEACDTYEDGMKEIILNSTLSPNLKWKATASRSKYVIDNFDQWQKFVSTLEKLVKKTGCVSIENDEVHVEPKEDKKASATKKLISKTNKRGVEPPESEESKQEQELATHANKIFSQHALDKHAGGPGKILTLPWNPTFQYRLTYAAAWIWAKGVMAKIATTDLPPNTSEFRYEIKKSRWIHPDMGVDHRVELRLQGGQSVSQSTSMAAIQPDLTSSSKKRIASEASEKMDAKPDLKKIKVEEEPKNSINDPIYISSDFESDWESDSESSGISIKKEHPSTSHAAEMDSFLAECDINEDDQKTRTLLKEAGIKSWTDLIPSLQLTESALVDKGIHRQLANRLMTEAQNRFSNVSVRG
ncbi:hypothetical protein DFH28DRAFT_1087823 [Melampsora americana]|nr:hypothetical protein DFH28DRAFT_1087823 [Melampsora americana]